MFSSGGFEAHGHLFCFGFQLEMWRKLSLSDVEKDVEEENMVGVEEVQSHIQTVLEARAIEWHYVRLQKCHKLTKESTARSTYLYIMKCFTLARKVYPLVRCSVLKNVSSFGMLLVLSYVYKSGRYVSTVSVKKGF